MSWLDRIVAILLWWVSISFAVGVIWAVVNIVHKREVRHQREFEAVINGVWTHEDQL